jgi:hypothetical protein
MLADGRVATEEPPMSRMDQLDPTAAMGGR